MGSENRKRANGFSLTIRLSEDERALIDRRAEAARLSRGAYIRSILLSSPDPRAARRPAIEHQVLARLLGELGQWRMALSGSDAGKEHALLALEKIKDACLEAMARGPAPAASGDDQ